MIKWWGGVDVGFDITPNYARAAVAAAALILALASRKIATYFFRATLKSQIVQSVTIGEGYNRVRLNSASTRQATSEQLRCQGPHDLAADPRTNFGPVQLRARALVNRLLRHYVGKVVVAVREDKRVLEL